MVFTRLIYHAHAHLHMSRIEADLTVFGELLDLIECWRHEQGISRPYREVFIDEVIPAGI